MSSSQVERQCRKKEERIFVVVFVCPLSEKYMRDSFFIIGFVLKREREIFFKGSVQYKSQTHISFFDRHGPIIKHKKRNSFLLTENLFSFSHNQFRNQWIKQISSNFQQIKIRLRVLVYRRKSKSCWRSEEKTIAG